LASTFAGVTLGAVVGVFSLGMLFPTSNNKVKRENEKVMQD
jgi:hypothetical protein